MKLGHKAGFGCIGILLVLFVLVMIVVIRNRPSPQEQAARAERTREYNAASICQDAVRRRLKAPATAVFQAPRNAQISRSASGDYEIDSYVDAQNSFGANLRSRYTCVVASTGEVVRLTIAGR